MINVDLLKKIIRKEIGSDAKLEYSIVMENNSGNKNPYTIKIPTTDNNVLKNPQVSMPLDIGNKTIRNPFVIPGLRKVNVDSNLNPNYSFENFLEGDCNRLARQAGFAVAEKPGGTAFNPLLIYGGVGLGMVAASVILEEIHHQGCNAAACHAQMYTMGTVLRHGSDEQKKEYLPKIADGTLRLQAFGVTEPTSGTDTTSLRTVAVRDGDDYVINGQKIWTSRAEHSDLMLLLARTKP